MRWPALGAILVLATACGLADGGGDVTVEPAAAVEPDPGAAPPTTVPTTAVPSTTVPSTAVPTTAVPTTPPTTVPSTTVPTTAVPTTAVPSTAVPAGPGYHDVGHVRYATANGVDLVLPAAVVELIGFHEAGHDGSQQQDPVDLGIPELTMETRDRNTGSRTAADIVVPPDAGIRAPVTGTVVRAGTYTLYCDHTDNFVVIEPDSRPGWEVKMFHFQDLSVGVGDRTEAGVTSVGSRATKWPFESQVDEFTAPPHNAHVHVEVIDPSIPDIPSGSGGC